MSEEIKIEVVGKISRVDVRPGDVFVLHIPNYVSREMQQQVQKWWAGKWGEGAPKLFIIPDGGQLGVIRREDLNPPPTLNCDDFIG